MINEYHINADSFGTILPYNWREIADYLNDIIDEYEYSDEKTNEVWNNYWHGKYEDAPKDISCESSDEELLQALDDADNWSEDFVEGAARELCERTGIDFDAYEDYDLLFNALEKAING